MEALTDVIDKKYSKSLLAFMKLVDPERKFGFDTPLIETWNRLTLAEQRKLISTSSTASGAGWMFTASRTTSS